MVYELDSGSVLGAVKIGHFLPWDIDGDVNVATRCVQLFSPRGEAYR